MFVLLSIPFGLGSQSFTWDFYIFNSINVFIGLFHRYPYDWLRLLFPYPLPSTYSFNFWIKNFKWMSVFNICVHNYSSTNIFKNYRLSTTRVTESEFEDEQDSERSRIFKIRQLLLKLQFYTLNEICLPQY